MAERIAERIPAEIVSADSMQVYRGLPVLTAQPEPPTRLVAIWELDHEASVVEYQALAHEAIDEALGQGRTPVVVGGTGLYLRAAISDLRRHLPGRGSAGSVSTTAWGLIGRTLRSPNEIRPPRTASTRTTAGASCAPSSWRRWARASGPRGHAVERETRHPTLVFGLDVPREELERRIELRTRAMFDAGVEDEVRSALAAPISRTARHALGLDEIARLPKEEAIAA